MSNNSEQVYIRRLAYHDQDALLEVRSRNRSFNQSFEPIQPDSHYTADGMKDMIHQGELHWELGTGFSFGIFLQETEQLIGRVSLSNVVRGAWENCTVGYYLDQAHNGRGLMTEALRLALRFAFDEAGLHRVQAAVMPRNLASIRVLEKVGFRYEGLAEYYLRINGKWEHHGIYSMTAEHDAALSDERALFQ